LNILPREKNASVRPKIQICSRHLQLAARHRDLVYLKRVRELTPSQSVNAYSDALGKLQANYVDRDKIGVTALFRQGLEEFGFALSDPTFRQAHLPDAKPDEIVVFAARVNEEFSNQTFKQATHAKLAVRDIAVQAQTKFGLKTSFTVMEFICGACNALDDQTGYIPPSEESAALDGQITALGARIGQNADGQIVVEGIQSGTWAAGTLHEGDRVTRLVRGDGEKEDNSQFVEITLAPRDGTAARTVRMPLALESVLDVGISPEGIGYLRITGFQKSTPRELDEKLMPLNRMNGLKALIVDLRGNSGGLFAVGVQVAERLLPEGIIVTTQGQTLNRTYASQSGMNAIDVPLYVLIDGDTASAAEILAGALKENQRAILIGQPTYGKGTMQQVLQLAAGNVRITLARFFTPRGRPYQGVGIAPHILETVDPQKAALDHARQALMMRP
jgi:carboxyl-terminal processing protease